MLFIESGDILIRAKGLFKHKEIALRDGLVLHNTPEKGEHVSDLQDFASGNPVQVTKPSLGATSKERARNSTGAREETATRCGGVFSREPVVTVSTC